LNTIFTYDCTSQQFDGAEETVRLPQVVANGNQTYPSTNRKIESSPLVLCCTDDVVVSIPERSHQADSLQLPRSSEKAKSFIQQNLSRAGLAKQAFNLSLTSAVGEGLLYCFHHYPSQNANERIERDRAAYPA
jgi:hypothetical protein